MEESDPIAVSVVIPIFNEEENLLHLFDEMQKALDQLTVSSEVVLVDDGSKDRSWEIMQGFPEKDGRFRVICLRRNFGQTAAFSAGFDHSTGDVVITMDGDLQNDPMDMPKLLDKMDEGYDIVSGWRIDRQDTFITRKLPSQIANRIISRSTGISLHDYGCSLKAYRREVIENTKLYGELHRFIPALASKIGVKVAEVPVNHRARQFGTSKYGLGRVVRVILDLMTVKFLLDYATRPMQIFGLMGLGSLGSGFAIGLYLTALRLFFSQGLRDRPLLLLSILLIVIGIQLFIMGLLGELIIRTYHETQDKPIYMVKEVL
ncbi:MAG: glycosyltransferase family 2 protein [Chloroflexi bacterium]|nr:glycosyltransferase family 2 protein [Chloroflexota bacterium]